VLYTEIAKSSSRSEESQKAVLTVPLNLSEDAQKQTRLAAEEAGFNVLQLITEPCAAVLAYDVGMQDPSQSWYVV
jgi:molecular chaperone DnaK (HSP70)